MQTVCGTPGVCAARCRRTTDKYTGDKRAHQCVLTKQFRTWFGVGPVSLFTWNGAVLHVVWCRASVSFHVEWCGVARGLVSGQCLFSRGMVGCCTWFGVGPVSLFTWNGAVLHVVWCQASVSFHMEWWGVARGLVSGQCLFSRGMVRCCTWFSDHGLF